MGMFQIVNKLASIDVECKKNAVLRAKLEPWVLEMNRKRPTSKKEALKISQDFIDKYNEIKKQIQKQNLKIESSIAFSLLSTPEKFSFLNQ
jgi:hypothetical protein